MRKLFFATFMVVLAGVASSQDIGRQHHFGIGIGTEVFPYFLDNYMSIGTLVPYGTSWTDNYIQYNELWRLDGRSQVSLMLAYRYDLNDKWSLTARINASRRKQAFKGLVYGQNAFTDWWTQDYPEFISTVVDVDIPLMIEKRFPINEHADWMASAGVGLSFNVKDTCSKTTSWAFESKHIVDRTVNIATGFDIKTKSDNLIQLALSCSYYLYPNYQYRDVIPERHYKTWDLWLHLWTASIMYYL